MAEKSNEIIAIPKLLDMLVIEGAIITIDAMGCQRGIWKPPSRAWDREKNGTSGSDPEEPRKNTPTAHAAARAFFSRGAGSWGDSGEKSGGHGAAMGRTDPLYEGRFSREQRRGRASQPNVVKIRWLILPHFPEIFEKNA